MPFPFILAAAAPGAISSLQVWIIGTSVAVGGSAVAGGGWAIYRWFRPAKKSDIDKHSTPFASIHKEVIQSQQTLHKANSTQISWATRSNQEADTARQLAEKLTDVAVRMASHQDGIERKSGPLKAEILKLLRTFQNEEHLIVGLTEKLANYILLKQGGKLSLEQELEFFKNILAYRDDSTEDKEYRLRSN